MRRLDWAELPAPLRHWVSACLGCDVVAATSAVGGFSPGAACVVRTATETSAFVKATATSLNEVSAALHRREGQNLRVLHGDPAVPMLLDTFNDDDWVALLMADVGASMPSLPWRSSDVAEVLDALAKFHQRSTPSPLTWVPTVAESMGEALGGWRRLAAEPVLDAGAGLDEWTLRHLDRLADLESRWAVAATGDTLLHTDLRSDNIFLCRPGVVFVDWPWACTGAGWFDVVALAPSVAADGGPGPEWLLDRYPPAATADPDAITAVVAAVAGYFTDQARRPPPALLDNPRKSQAKQGRAARAWLRARTGWR